MWKWTNHEGNKIFQGHTMSWVNVKSADKFLVASHIKDLEFLPLQWLPLLGKCQACYSVSCRLTYRRLEWETLYDRSKWRRTIHEGTKLIQEHSVSWVNVNRAGNWKSLIQCSGNLPVMNVKGYIFPMQASVARRFILVDITMLEIT